MSNNTNESATSSSTSSSPAHFSTAANKKTLSELEIAYKVMESIMNISLAGFGGALCGLAISRRGGLSPAIARAAASTTTKYTTSARAPYYIDHELPTAWAVACITFASVVEFTRLTSPATRLMELYKTSVLMSGRTNTIQSTSHSFSMQLSSTPEIIQDESSSTKNESFLKQYYPTLLDEDLCVILDYTFGGAAAGAMFKGSVIRTQAAKKGLALRGGAVLPASAIAARTGILTGLIPGATLGFCAGSMVYGVLKLQKYIERHFYDPANRDAVHETAKEQEELHQLELDDDNRS